MKHRPPNRIRSRLEVLRARGEGAFVPFLVIGDPDLETSLAVADALVAAGADALEIGLPFSDPPADGPVIQAADVRALAAGTRVDDCFVWLAEVSRRHPDVPISLLIYFNLVMQQGIERFYERAAAAGVDAVLVADVPLEESAPLVAAARAHRVAPVFIASELTTDARLGALAAVADGYVYAVARVGITGEQHAVSASLAGHISRFRAAFELPILVGFGVSSPDHVRAVLDAGADGAICGSAIVRRIADHLDDRAAMIAAIHDFAGTMKAVGLAAPARGLGSAEL